jgi:hypothetical protein
VTGINLTLTTVPCPVCGAIVFVELTSENPGTLAGLPADTRTKHAEWHERTGTT